MEDGGPGWAGARAAELAAAVVLLTRLPAGRLVRGAWPEPARCVWAFGPVGLIVGLIGAAVLAALRAAGLPALPASVVAVVAVAWATGGLHEDGLADCFDALGGGRTVERRLVILRDSRIGAHGALALMLAVLVRVSCLAVLPAGRAAAALVVAAVLGRGAMLVVVGGILPARQGGLAAPLAAAGRDRLGAGLALSVLPALGAGAWGAAVAAGLVAVAAARRARVLFGGYTGDVLGAVAVTAEAAALLAMATGGA